jgi:hypothetical protein
MYDSKAGVLTFSIWGYLIQDQVTPVKLKWIFLILFYTCQFQSWAINTKGRKGLNLKQKLILEAWRLL